MPSKRAQLALAAAAAFFVALTPIPADAQSVPTSVGLLHFDGKNFEVGDWVMYRVRGSNIRGEESVDYQRVQVVAETQFRGENCFWLETGWGPSPDRLTYTAVLVSEGIFEEEIPQVRHGMYVRKMHIGSDDQGIPRSMEVRLANPGRPLPDLSYLKPEVDRVGVDTVKAANRTFVCDVLEEVASLPKMRDLPDSTVRLRSESKRRRWVSASVPITGLVHETERKVHYRQAWPLGRPSEEFPEAVTELFDLDIELIEIGTGAKPQIAHLIVDSPARALPGDVDQP